MSVDLKSISMWWIRHGQQPNFHPGAHSLLLSGIGGRKYDGKSLWVKVKTVSLPTNSCCGQNRLDLGKITLIYCQKKIDL